jgi:hypothetical protein
MSNVSRNGVALLAMVIASAVLAGGCKEDAKSGSGGAAGGGSGSTAKGPDLSNPKSAAVSFAKAIQSNDMAAAKAASTGTDEQYKMVEAMGQMMSGFKNYESAAVAKFGDAGKSDQSPPDIVADTEGSDVKTEGDTATVINPKKPDDKDPMKLVKKDGKWKVDLASMPIDEQAKTMAASASKMKKALDDTAEEIKAGKYPTAQEAQKALGMKMQAAMAPVSGG